MPCNPFVVTTAQVEILVAELLPDERALSEPGMLPGEYQQCTAAAVGGTCSHRSAVVEAILTYIASAAGAAAGGSPAGCRRTATRPLLAPRCLHRDVGPAALVGMQKTNALGCCRMDGPRCILSS